MTTTKDTATHYAAFILCLENRLSETGIGTKRGNQISDSISELWQRWDFAARGVILTRMNELKAQHPSIDWVTEWASVPGV